MITKLQNKDTDIALKIRSVFQVSYAIEAKLLDATDFPPLKRPLESFKTSNNQFFGYYKDQELAGVIEIDQDHNSTHIQSLVVDPKFFRQGIGLQLLDFTFNSFNSELFTVETGLKNDPATTLYKKLGFKEIKQWDTEFGIRKIRFERKTNN